MKLNLNKIADAFYNENWDYFKEVFGTKPQNHMEAEQIVEDWKKKYQS